MDRRTYVRYRGFSSAERGRHSWTCPAWTYAELHCHSNFSFLDGASHPEELVEEAARLGLAALALTDHDGFYGVVRFAEAAREVGLPTVFGAELTLDAPRRLPNGMADPPGEHLLVLAQGPVGHSRLARAISTAQLAGEKGAPRSSLAVLAEAARAPVFLNGDTTSRENDAWFVATGCRKGTVPAALQRDGPLAAERAVRELVDAFGRDRVLVELWDHGDPLDRHRNDALVQIALRTGVEVIATNNVHYATPARRPLATALAAVRARRSLDEIDGWLPAAPFAHLRAPAEQMRRFARWPGAVERTVDIARACAFDLKLAAPELPDYPVPAGHTEMTWLRELVRRGAAVYYPPTHEQYDQAMRQIDYELASSSSSGSPGTSCCCTTSSSSAAAATSTARVAAARRTARSVTRSASPKRMRSRSGSCSNGSCHPNATVPPTSTSTSSTNAARR